MKVFVSCFVLFFVSFQTVLADDGRFYRVSVNFPLLQGGVSAEDIFKQVDTGDGLYETEVEYFIHVQADSGFFVTGKLRKAIKNEILPIVKSEACKFKTIDPINFYFGPEDDPWASIRPIPGLGLGNREIDSVLEEKQYALVSAPEKFDPLEIELGDDLFRETMITSITSDGNLEIDDNIACDDFTFSMGGVGNGFSNGSERERCVAKYTVTCALPKLHVSADHLTEEHTDHGTRHFLWLEQDYMTNEDATIFAPVIPNVKGLF